MDASASLTEAEQRSLLLSLIEQRPRFHGEEETSSQHLHDQVLEWLHETLRPGQLTCETGAGTSTILFALRGCRHTVISPLPQEHERIRTWCHGHELPLGGVRFIAGRSEQVLPGLEGDPWDLCLIDGRHAFPTPFVDYYYLSERLAVGGLLVVHDTQIRPCAILREFLLEERDRWEPVVDFWRSTVFRKLSPILHDDVWWGNQPWSAKAGSVRDAARRAVQTAAKHTVGRSPELKAAAYRAYHRLTSRPKDGPAPDSDPAGR